MQCPRTCTPNLFYPASETSTVLQDGPHIAACDNPPIPIVSRGPIDTFTYSGGELRSHDVTALLNAALLVSPYFAARLEATVPPGALGNYYGDGE